MEGVNIWENASWTVQARNIIKAVKQFPESSKIIVILRHSHRNNPKESEKMHELKLTPQGHQIAKIFGQKLPLSRKIRLFHSVVDRCQETAEDILTGFESVGGKGTLNGALTPLFHAGTAPKFFLNVFKNESPIEFIFRWAVGFYSPDTITPFQSYCQNAAEIIWKRVNDAQESGIDIHITHDIFLIALRYGWFGLPPDQEWIPFLGGVAFVLTENDINLFDKDRFFSIPNPYWWKSKISPRQ
ncbi:MAG: histidine phosphatase family protein [Candidatus Lokiarchaeota archaeon]|nr:histidine phosphatase family protein [Candidatus Lokiarchaeota archaeon]